MTSAIDRTSHPMRARHPPSEGASPNPFAFIVGAPRSGTTLLKRIVDAHPDVAITRETHWITQLIKGEENVSPALPATLELRSRLASHRRFARLRRDLALMGLHGELDRLLAPDREASYADLVSGVFDLYARGVGKRFVGDKTPRYVRHIPTLHALWPEARFVHLIRDGRDVCSSVAGWDNEKRMVKRFSTWETDPVSTIAVWWEQLVRLGREAGAELPGRYHEVRYEDLVGDPVRECVGLCGFLGVPYDERMVSFQEGRTKDDPTLDAKHGWRPITTGLRSWRSEMSRPDLERFEAVAGGLLDELGYPRGIDDPSADAIRHARRVHSSYVHEARRQRLPQAWRR